MNKKKQLTLYVDTRRCMGCRACEIACKLENSLPRGPRYTMVTETEVIEDGVDKLKFLPVPCQHCADAPCLKASFRKSIGQGGTLAPSSAIPYFHPYPPTLFAQKIKYLKYVDKRFLKLLEK